MTKAQLEQRIEALKVEVSIVRQDAYRRGYRAGLMARPKDDRKAYQAGYRAALFGKESCCQLCGLRQDDTSVGGDFAGRGVGDTSPKAEHEP